MMDQVLAGDATPVQLAGFLVALRSKGETAAEITGLAEAMLRHTRRVVVEGRAVDVVGTGGDHAHTVNISTMSAVVTAAAGVPVVKHGNRAATSACGAADVLEELGVAIDLPPAAVAACVARGRHRLLLRGRLPPVDAAHLGAAPRAGHPDGDERARPAHQPGPAERGPGRVRRLRASRRCSRRCSRAAARRCSWCAATTASTS